MYSSTSPQAGCIAGLCSPFRLVRGRSDAPCVSVRISAAVKTTAAYFKLTFSQSAAAPLPLFALLLPSMPSGLTLRTLFALNGFGERSHRKAAQLTASGLL